MIQNKKKLTCICLLQLLLVSIFGCSFSRKKPCTLGGQPPREDGSTFKGIKKCYQAVDPATGGLLNDGKYKEFYNSDKLALEGEYKNGKKTGRWKEYDEDGKKVLDKYFDEGKEVQPR